MNRGLHLKKTFKCTRYNVNYEFLSRVMEGKIMIFISDKIIVSFWAGLAVYTKSIYFHHHITLY